MFISKMACLDVQKCQIGRWYRGRGPNVQTFFFGKATNFIVQFHYSSSGVCSVYHDVQVMYC